jgi:hypothetical protein
VRREKGAIAPVRCAECGRARHEERERLARIEQAAPPASTFEGQLQRRVRDREEPELETVWDGTRGKAGASLTSDLYRTGLRN